MEDLGEGARLVILDSPFRLFIEPLLEYIEEIIDSASQMKRLPSLFRSSFPPNAGISPAYADSRLSAPGIIIKAWGCRHGCSLPGVYEEEKE